MNKNRDIKKILVLRTEHIGDYICSIPSLRTLRENYPNAKITAVVGSWNEKIAKATPYIDEVLVFNNPFAKRDISYLEIFKIFITKSIYLIRFFKNIRKTNYDLLISFSDRNFNKILLPYIRAKRKISGLEFELKKEHEIKRCLAVLEPLNLKKKFQTGKLSYSKREAEELKRLLKDTEKKEKIVIHCISPVKYKIWPLERWADIINLLNNGKRKFIITGIKEDKEQIERIIKKVKEKRAVINLAGKISLSQLFLLMKKSNLFLGILSGPMELAILAELPVMGIFGSEDKKIWGPFRRGEGVIQKDNVADITVQEFLKLIKKNAKSDV